MTPGQLGHRAAAQGNSEETCPFPAGHTSRVEWFRAYGMVVVFRAAGRDPNGHQPINPHLCVRDPRKVCNCCTSCSTACREEERTGVLHTLGGIARKGCVKLVKRLEAIAAPPVRQGEAKGPERFYCAEFLRMWALRQEDSGRRALLSNLAYAVANGHHVDAVVRGDMAPHRSDVPTAAQLHSWFAQPTQPLPSVSGGPLVPDGYKLGDGWEVDQGKHICTFGQARHCDADSIFDQPEGPRAACRAHAVKMGALVPVKPPAEREPDWSRFVPTAETCEHGFVGPEGLKEGDVYQFKSINGACGVRKYGSSKILAGHDDNELLNVKVIIRHADGRWADGFNPGGPCASFCNKRRGALEPCMPAVWLTGGFRTDDVACCTQFCADRIKAATSICEVRP